jgi:hypothetical protein
VTRLPDPRAQRRGGIAGLLSQKPSMLLRCVAAWVASGIVWGWINVRLALILEGQVRHRLGQPINPMGLSQYLVYVPWYAALGALAGAIFLLVRGSWYGRIWLILTFLSEAFMLVGIVAYDPNGDPRSAAIRVDGDGYVGAIMGAIWAPVLMAIVVMVLWVLASGLRRLTGLR